MRLAGALRDIGARQADMGRRAEALRFYQQSLALDERLVREHPDVINYRWGLTAALQSIGWTHYRLFGRNEDGRAAFRKALDIAESIARENPDLETARATVAYYNHELGRILTRLGKPKEALEHFRLALEYCEQRLQKNPGSVWERRELGYLRYETGRIHQAGGRIAEASQSLAEAQTIFEELGESRIADPYNRACAKALCAGLVGLAKSDLSPEEHSRRRKFTGKAVAILREAAAGGLQSPDMIASDIDFEGIKSDEDFKALVAELRSKTSADQLVAPGW